MSRRNIPTFGRYFCGLEISSYGIANGYVDYATLAASFQHVLCNNAWGIIDDWSYENGDFEDEAPEVFQWYIISDSGAEILKDYTNEIVYYSESLGVYLWGITHFGTGWDYVLTDIPCEKVPDKT